MLGPKFLEKTPEESQSEEGEMSGDRETKGTGEKCSPILFSSHESKDIAIPLSGFVTEKVIIHILSIYPFEIIQKCMQLLKT